MASRPKRRPRFLSVKSTHYLSPNLIRVTFAGPELEGFPSGHEGANCKLVLPRDGETRQDFEAYFEPDGPEEKIHPVRTYTVRAFRAESLELDIDFVAHGDNGPATRWAQRAGPGSFLGFLGPSQPKITDFHADWYLLAADLSAMPVVEATLEAMPAEACGVTVFEVPSADDIREIAAPAGIELHWLVQADVSRPSTAQFDFVKALQWPSGTVQTCIAGESSVIRALRDYLHNELNVPKNDTYISGYWKIGMVEDQHQQMKREEAAAVQA
ncbi:siderophore-interacting protein [Roseibium marinum]|uniref:NADPH-dependent ferric siderophore reductase n=1 Tax=Roseibium marinum TaxID=281252 RepID=A0A2S3ULT2_9HYPH|nr:siderophore-interacting protein [Roseibium marinum]POF28641.1 NADPH-dependent ferric siderophore reductase [Roseibium marinum]